MRRIRHAIAAAVLLAGLVGISPGSQAATGLAYPGEGILLGVVDNPTAICTTPHTFPALVGKGALKDGTDTVWIGTFAVSGLFASPYEGECAAGVINQIQDSDTGDWIPTPATFSGSSPTGSVSGSIWGTFIRITRTDGTPGPYWQLVLNHLSFSINGGPVFHGLVNLEWTVTPDGGLQGRYGGVA